MISVAMAAARSAPRSEPAKSQDFRPSVNPRRARSAALFVIGNPVPTCRRRGQPWARQTLLDDPNLCLIRPSTAPTRVNNLKTTDGPSVSKDIHTDSQLYPAPFGKAAYTG
jgi:hypothetical protein